MVKDMTRGNTAKQMINFAIPLLIGNVFSQLYNFSDAAIVGKALGAKAFAAVGGTSGSLLFFIFGFFFGMTSGLAVVTGQRFGAGDEEGVRKSVAASTIICLVMTLTSTAGFLYFLPGILNLMNVPADIVDNVRSYLSVLLIGCCTMVMYGLLASILRALGDSLTPLIFLIFSCIVNVGLDLLFILKFHWGIAGAAWATVFTQGLSGVLCLTYVIKKFPILRMHWCNWNVCRAFYMEHLRIAVPMALQCSITALGCVAVVIVLNRYGSSYIAGSTAAVKIQQIAIQPMFSFGIAMAAFAAQNYGARNFERIREGVRVCSAISMTISTIAGLLTVIFADQLIGLCINASEVQVFKAAREYLYTCCAFFWFLTMLLVYRNVLQGIGQTFWPMMAGVAELVVRFLVAVFAALGWGYTGVCYSDPLAWTGGMIVVWIAYLFAMKKLKANGIPSKDGLVRRTESKNGITA